VVEQILLQFDTSIRVPVMPDRSTIASPRKKANNQSPTDTLLDPLLALLQTQQPCIAFPPLMLRAHQRAHNCVLRYLGKFLLVRFNLSGQTVELGPVDLFLLVSEYEGDGKGMKHT
jgi:hypothetical protein